MKGSPAYLWYPKDYLVDEAVVDMTLEQEGAYRRLIDFCWIEGSIPNDIARLADRCKTDAQRMAELWSNASGSHRTSLCERFVQHPDDPSRLVHPRLDEERAKEESHREKRAAAAQKAARKRWQGRGKQRVRAGCDPHSDRNATGRDASSSNALRSDAISTPTPKGTPSPPPTVPQRTRTIRGASDGVGGSGRGGPPQDEEGGGRDVVTELAERHGRQP